MPFGRLRSDNCRDGYLLDLERYLDCWDSRLVSVLAIPVHYWNQAARNPSVVCIFAQHDRLSAIRLFDETLAQRNGFAPLNPRGRALLSVGLFMVVPERWELAWSTLEKCKPALARRVFFEAASEYLDRDFRFHEPLTTSQLTSICARVWKLFPPSEYNEWNDEHGHVGSRHMMPGLRDGLTGTLVTRATPEACASLQKLARLVRPDQRVWMQWRYNEAVKNALRLAWTARTRTTAEILAIARDFRAVTIDNSNDLLDAVRSSLERLQHRLRNAESAEIHALWNETGHWVLLHRKTSSFYQTSCMDGSKTTWVPQVELCSTAKYKPPC